MNKTTRFILAILTILFSTVQLITGITSVILVIETFKILFSGLPKDISSVTEIFGVDVSNYNVSFLSERQVNLLIYLFALVFMIVMFFLLQYLRTILLNLNEGEVFSTDNLKYIRRIMILYFTLNIGGFIFESLSSAANNTNIITGDLIGGLIQVIMMTAGIYTLYSVFKYGFFLKKDNEEIV